MIILIHAQVILYNTQRLIYDLLGCDIRCNSCTDGMASTCGSCNLPYINFLPTTCNCTNGQFFDINYGICERNILNNF